MNTENNMPNKQAQKNPADIRESIKSQANETASIKILKSYIKTLDRLNTEVLFYPRTERVQMKYFRGEFEPLYTMPEISEEIRQNIKLQEHLVDKIRSIQGGR